MVWDPTSPKDFRSNQSGGVDPGGVRDGVVKAASVSAVVGAQGPHKGLGPSDQGTQGPRDPWT